MKKYYLTAELKLYLFVISDMTYFWIRGRW